jgi:hypothetical protein
LLAVWDGKRRIHEDDIPTSFNAAPDIFYRFVVRLSDGRVWEKKLSVKRGQTSTLSVLMDAPAVAEEEHHRRHHDDAPPPPQAMSADDFSALKAAIMREDFEPQKMTVLQTAVTSAWFTISQVGELVDMFNFTSGKTKVVEVTRARILDMNNASQIYTHFDFESDKKRVRAILGH